MRPEAAPTFWFLSLSAMQSRIQDKKSEGWKKKSPCQKKTRPAEDVDETTASTEENCRPHSRE